MKIKTINRQHRGDKSDYQEAEFYADYECEGCGHVEMDQPGYDDSYFHDTVIPGMICKQCGQSANSLGAKPGRKGAQ